jgi:hypothetical protein
MISHSLAGETNEYRKRRESLIFKAEGHANKKHGRTFKGDVKDRADWADKWNATYFREMNRLAREEGL